MHGGGRVLGRTFPESPMATLLRAFLSQRLQRRAQGKSSGSGGDVESHSRAGRSGRSQTQGASCHEKTGRHEAGQSCAAGLRGDRRDAGIHGISLRALATYPHQQSALLLTPLTQYHILTIILVDQKGDQ